MKVSRRRLLCDAPESGLLAVSLFEDERPLRGSVGLLDWRLAGRLSLLLKENRLRGRWGEMALVLPGGRFFGTKILVEGLGPMSQFSFQRFEEAGVRLTRTITDLGIASITAALPGLHRFPVWGNKVVECSEAVKAFLMTLASIERDGREVLLHLVVEEGLHDDILLGLHKARVALKEKKIPLELIESHPVAKGG